ILTVLALLVVGIVVAVALEIVVGQALLNNASAAFNDLTSLRIQSATPENRSAAAESNTIDLKQRPNVRSPPPNVCLSKWISTVANCLQFPSIDQTNSHDSESIISAGTALLDLLKIFILPVLAGVIGAYCSFARWLMARVGALALAPGDIITVIVSL